LRSLQEAAGKSWRGDRFLRRSQHFPENSPQARDDPGVIPLAAKPRYSGSFTLIKAGYWPTILAARLARRNVQVVITRHLMTARDHESELSLELRHVVAVSRAVQAVLARELRGPKERLHLVYGSIDPEQFQSCDADAIQQFRQTHGWKPNEFLFLQPSARSPFLVARDRWKFLGAAARIRPVVP